jgi:uncharacterized membrane protein YraQ (UPF0718 family)
MGRFVVLGAGLAAVFQTAVPASVADGVAADPVFGTLAMMGLAFVMSLCSEADAFVAVSFSQFAPASQLAFMVFGPILDLKLALLYGATFGWPLVGRVALVGVPWVFVGSLLFGVFAA